MRRIGPRRGLVLVCLLCLAYLFIPRGRPGAGGSEPVSTVSRFVIKRDPSQEPWSPPLARPKLADIHAHDVLRRRSFDPRAESLEVVPIERPPDPLAQVHLSPSFHAIYKKLYHDRAGRDLSLNYDYHRLLDKHLFENKTEDCGSWQGEYASFHREARRMYNDTDPFARKPAGIGERPKRIVAACAKGYGQCGGLGDRMFGIVSSFMLALLLDRIFLVYWSPDFPLYAETVWHSPHINWAWPGPPDEVTPSEVVGPEHPAVRNPHMLFIEMQPEIIDKEFLTSTRHHLENELLPAETITFQGNKGILVRQLLQNTTWQYDKLSKMGFTPENAYRCVINYLFEPLPHTRALIAQYQALLSLDFVFSITLQIRVGDHAFIDPEKDDDLAPWYYYFECALDAATAFADPDRHTHFVIYLATDHSHLAEEAVRDVSQFIGNWTHPTIPDFAPLVLTTAVKPIHLEKGDDLVGMGQGRYNTLDEATKHYAMQSSILDNYIQDATELRFTCHWSGFGLISQLRSWKGPTGTPMPTIWYKGDQPKPETLDGLKCSDPAAYYTLEDWAFSGYKLA